MPGGFKARSAEVSRFSMVPRGDIPRSVFKAEQTHKTAFNAGFLVPVYVDEILPGDSCSLNMTAFCRLSTPIFPVMDNMYLDTFFFFVPCRLVWDNFNKFMGEQLTPGASTSYLIPTHSSNVGGFAVGSLMDYFGIPTVGQVDGAGVTTINALPLRAYSLIYNEWFRDQNLQNPLTVLTDDGPDTIAELNGGLGYIMMPRGKRHDYFTSALPWPMRETSLTSWDNGTVGIFKGGAKVSGLGAANLTQTHANQLVYETGGPQVNFASSKLIDATTGTPNGQVFMKLDSAGLPDVRVTINDMRLAFAAQRLMERDARGGTRYTEIVRSHFGVLSPDARLQRPEYLGGGTTPITVTPIVQQSATKVGGETAGGATPLGSLGGVGTGVATGHGFSSSFTEHGYIIGIACVRADLTYQQGIAKMWTRRTKYDLYWPAFAHLGEQAILRNEIYHRGTAANDDVVFGYQERWAEYRHKPNRVSGLFRSTAASTIDAWHLAQRFTVAPVLNYQFIQEDPPLERVLAVGAGAAGQEILFDSLFSVRMVRPIPTFSVPGLADHF